MNNDERKFILEIIRMYRELPILWKVNSLDYSNRIKKAQAYTVLIEKFKEKYPGADREMVVRKINSLRTNYRKEQKRVAFSQIADNERIKPRLWYYDELSFLNDQQDYVSVTPPILKTDVDVPIVIKNEVSDSGIDDIPGGDSEAELHDSNSSIIMKRQRSISTETSHCVSCGVGGVLNPGFMNDYLPTSVYASKCNEHSQNINLAPSRDNGIRPYSNYSTSSNNLTDRNSGNMTEQQSPMACKKISVAEDSEFEHLAKIWASDLQKMEPKQCLFARKAISDVLFEGMLGNLERDSVQITIRK